MRLAPHPMHSTSGTDTTVQVAPMAVTCQSYEDGHESSVNYIITQKAICDGQSRLEDRKVKWLSKLSKIISDYILTRLFFYKSIFLFSFCFSWFVDIVVCVR
ncbi:hypothetical protein HanLR1_Chr15g0577621 [Helianthus annuus]|nr:hypothetical protein HanLR1_Chr15g0577621 [Helianthus annuus]